MSEDTNLAKVLILGGGQLSEPIYKAELRVFNREDKIGINEDSIVRRVFGLRGLAVGAGESFRTPRLARLYVRPKAYPNNNGRTLMLRNGEQFVSGELQETEAAQEISAVPSSEWERGTSEIPIPPLLFAAGRVEANVLKTGSAALRSFLSAKFASGKLSLFDGFTLKTVGQDTGIVLRLAPEGIEFEGSLLDPTRDVTKPASTGPIEGTFRLEGVYDPVKKTTSYALRLIWGDADAMEALETRIGSVFNRLSAEKDSPFAIRLDRRPGTPPLVWPLITKSGKLVLSADAGEEPWMEIDRSAIDVRIRSKSGFPGHAPSLATLAKEQLKWRRRSNGGIEVDVSAGSSTGSAPEIAIRFDRSDGVWSSTIASTARLFVHAPFGPLIERVRPLYAAARLLANPASFPPFAFLPTADGWLQLSLERTAAHVEPAGQRRDALAGRIVASRAAPDGRMRGVVIEQAARLALMLKWAKPRGASDVEPETCTMILHDPVGRTAGFLYAAETAPTAEEALPDLRRGPAATRDLPLEFGVVPSGPSLSGTFVWAPEAAGAPWSLSDANLRSNTAEDGGNLHVAWRRRSENAFVTSYPLTRSALSSTVPSISRDLLPRQFGGAISLEGDDTTPRPRLALKNPKEAAWPEIDEDQAEGRLFSDDSAGFRRDGLVFPSLPGVELAPAALPEDGKPLNAALRHDLPILDELFAFAAPPPAPGSATSSTSPPPTPMVTALDWKGLTATWRMYRQKLALTRTQDAFVTDWLETGKTHASIPVTSLVQPYAWTAKQVRIDVSAGHGSFVLGESTDLYEGEQALVGLSRDFKVQGNKLVPGRQIMVRGQAAGLFALRTEADPAKHLLHDTRGSAMAAGFRDGRRAARIKQIKNGNVEVADFSLLTSPKPQRIVIDGTPHPWMRTGPTNPVVAFYVRDLPIVADVFDMQGNPVEGKSGSTGAAFDSEGFAKALYEWRFFEPLAAMANEARMRRPHDITFGPFLFKPLRLERAVFDAGATACRELWVVGSLRLTSRSGSSDEGPYGPDHVYVSANLFRLKLVRGTNDWLPTWEAVRPKEPEFGAGVLMFEADTDRSKAMVRLELDWEIAGGGIGSLQGGEKVRGSLIVDLGAPTMQQGATAYPVELAAHLFGRRCRLGSLAEVTRDGIEFEIAGKRAAAQVTSAAWLRIDRLKVSVNALKGNCIAVHGAVLATPDAKTSTEALAAALVAFDPDLGKRRWLDISGDSQGNPTFSIDIDHARGMLLVAWNSEDAGSVRPLFGLDASEWRMRARLAAMLPIGDKLTTTLRDLQLPRVWMRCFGIDGTGMKRIDHRLEIDEETSHWLDLTWQKTFQSPIAWPIDAIVALDGSMNPDWFDADKAKNEEKERSRDVQIRDSKRSLTHATTVRLNRHRIAADELKRLSNGMAPVKALRLLVQTEHELVEPKSEGDGSKDNAWRWSSLDHVSLTTIGLMQAEAEIAAFAPRYTWDKHSYRGLNGAKSSLGHGAAQMQWAFAGLHDQALTAHLKEIATKKPDLANMPFLLGGAMLSVEAASIGHALVLPWMGLHDDLAQPLGKLQQPGLKLRVSSADLWVRQTGELTRRTASAMPGGRTAREIIDALARLQDPALNNAHSAFDPASLVPVEQAFFEKIVIASGVAKPVAFAPSDIGQIPLFLRSIATLSRIWEKLLWQDERLQNPPRVLSMHPAQHPDSKASLVLIEQTPENASPEAPAALPADLIVLSHSGISTASNFRAVRADFADDIGDQRAEIVQRARDLDRHAAIAIRQVDPDGAPPALPHILLGASVSIFDAAVDVADYPRLVASPALGWPSDETAGNDLQLGASLAPELGAELPVQAAKAGFAGRFQQFGYPAATRLRESALSFSERVIYERASAVPFDGPAGRHLTPVNARLRAPEALNLEEMEIRPQLAPFVERATIGRRPGVMNAVAAYVTEGADEALFDDAHPRFGRPASSGPVAAHQLRTPRAPPLPSDAADREAAEGRDELLFRRRTYVSKADTDVGGKLLATHLTFMGSGDVLRHEAGPDSIRLSVQLQPALVGPATDGSFLMSCNAAMRRRDRSSGAPDRLSPVEPRHLRVELEKWLRDASAAVVIGNEFFPAKLLVEGAGFGATFGWRAVVVDANLTGLRDALRAATVDSPMRLVVTVPSGAAGPNSLPPSPTQTAVVPLALAPGERSVLLVPPRTVVFGDPAYDRQLSSPTASDMKLDPAPEPATPEPLQILLAADRKEYALASTVHLAVGHLDEKTGLFAKGAAASFFVTLALYRKPMEAGRLPDPLALKVEGCEQDDGRYAVAGGKAFEFAIANLRISGAPPTRQSPANAGDQIEITVERRTDVGGIRTYRKAVSVRVMIVDQPVIAPPPAVYSVLAKTAGSHRIALHAAAPLPQHVEFLDLERDLAQGHVRRRALFVWRYVVEAGEPKGAQGDVQLLKYDRSGGAQLQM